MNAWITEDALDLNALLAATADPACGALVVFTGTVRNENDDQPVTGMTYEAHVELATNVIRQIEAEVLERFPVRQCRIAHRIGALALGDESVIVVVRSGHRTEAFEAARYGIDAVKQRVPIWKHEHYVAGESKYLDGVPLRQDD
ncbi:MAG: molybdenum cofactor biosynthesis protein MoaE [Anaerolineae bacterium]|nr:molybdenum cofactor biosynthesis protein MoaE [Anaerolineae bacterium]